VRCVQSGTICSAGERCSVSDDTFARAMAVLGEQGMADLIGCLGNFSMLAMLLNTFQVDLQPVEPPFPDVHGFARVPAGQPVAER
jgi:hypothetical protein